MMAVLNCHIETSLALNGLDRAAVIHTETGEALYKTRCYGNREQAMEDATAWLLRHMRTGEPITLQTPQGGKDTRVEPIEVDLESYIEKAVRTESNDFAAIAARLRDHRTIRLLHAAIGKATEAGECLDAMKKFIFYGKPLDETNLIEEQGDGHWYDAIMANTLGVTFEDIQARNIAKLAKRYPDKFSQADALTRDLAAERKALEGAPLVKQPEKVTFSWSKDGAMYQGRFDSREAALADARGNYASLAKAVLYTGENEPISMADVVGDLSDDAFEHMADRASDLAGESAEGFPWDEVSDEQAKELNEAIATAILAWAERHGIKPAFWQVGKVHEHRPEESSPTAMPNDVPDCRYGHLPGEEGAS